MPTQNDNGNRIIAASGRFAINKNAASPIVAVSVATTAPMLTEPDEYAATTITAPPHPGIAPIRDANGTCAHGARRKTPPMLKPNNFSAP